MSRQAPQVIVIGGPNGAGKSTIARDVLEGTLGITEFVNADTIAAGLSGFDPERAAFAAGRIMLSRLHELAAAGESFAFESTLASRSFAPWLRDLADRGYGVRLIYVWLGTPELALARVQARVKRGGHDIPEAVVRRRYSRSARNLLNMYLPIASTTGTWRVYDNSREALRLVASGGVGAPPIIRMPPVWRSLEKVAHGDATQSLSDVD